MTKEQILKHLSEAEWTRDLQDRLEEAVANFVVHEVDPDSGYGYGHVYHITEREARADFVSRNSVASGRWCKVVLRELHCEDDMDRLYESRTVALESVWD